MTQETASQNIQSQLMPSNENEKNLRGNQYMDIYTGTVKDHQQINKNH
jgi:hypothetical protein